MKVLLVKSYSVSDHIQPPLGLAYLASSIKVKHEVNILDMLKEKMRINAFIQYVIEKKYDVVGFQCYTQELYNVKRLIRVVKEVSPGTTTIVGGPHPTLLPRETMNFLGSDVDFLLVGEGEIFFPIFLDKLERKNNGFHNISGLIWRNEGKVIVNPPGDFINDLDELSFPSWDIIQPHTYPPAQHGAFFKNFPIAPVITTRGCPFSCKFCSAPLISGKKVRKRNPDKVLEEIKILYSEYGIREIHIVDDNFTIDKEHAKNVLRKIIESGLKISLAFPNGIRIETIDDKLLDLMKKSGVYLISAGLESGSNRMLRMMNKKLTVEQTEQKINMIKKVNIDIAGFFVIGFPGETKEEIEQTIDFSLRLPLLRANYFDFLPLPGTKIYYELEQKGELNNIDWRNFFFMNAPYSPKGITRHELRNLQRKAFFKFYFRLRIFIKNILQIKSFKQIKYLLRRFYHWVVME